MVRLKEVLITLEQSIKDLIKDCEAKKKVCSSQLYYFISFVFPFSINVLSHKATCPATCRSNELPIKMALLGRPVIGLFTELSQRHVARVCHTRRPNMRATFCRRGVSQVHATSRGVELHKKHKCYSDGLPCVTGPSGFFSVESSCPT